MTADPLRFIRECVFDLTCDGSFYTHAHKRVEKYHDSVIRRPPLHRLIPYIGVYIYDYPLPQQSRLRHRYIHNNILYTSKSRTRDDHARVVKA